MICLLCLIDTEEFITIFKDLGIEYNAEEIIKKHFWITPEENDPEANAICKSCWLKVNAFHTFYIYVADIHKNEVLLEESAIKFPNDNLSLDFDSHHLEPCSYVDISEDRLSSTDSGSKLFIDTSKTSEPSTPSVPEDEISKAESSLYNTRRSTLRNRSKLLKPNESKKDNPASLEKNIGKDKSLVQAKPRRRGRPRKGEIVEKSKKLPHPVALQRKLLSNKCDELIAEHIKLTCNVCSSDVPNFSSLKKHYRSVHNERGYATCCNKKFLKRGVLVDHIRLHLNPEHFKCKECEKILADRRCLEMHMLTHQTDKCKIFQCDGCPKTFQKRSVLKRHREIHIPEDKWQHKCDECSKLFPSDYSLKAHVKNVHQRVYAKICDICGKSIRAGKTALKQHLLEHEGISLPNFQCEKCGVKLRNKYSLKRHVEAMHSESNITEVCKICGKISPNPNALKRHYYYVHQCQRKYKCTICEKAFKKPNTLKEHMTTHTGEVLYTCPHCPKTFNSSANMHSHRKKAHRTEWELNRKMKRPLLLGNSKVTEIAEEESIEIFPDL